LLDCPFRELGLIEAVPDTPKTWRFTDTPRLGVPAAVVAYAALDYMARNDLTGQVTTARLAHEPGGVGKAFRLTEPALAAALVEIANERAEIQLIDSVGQRTLMVSGNPAALAQEVIAAYYAPAARRSRKEAAAPRSHKTTAPVPRARKASA
jgi:hypothetical protein